MTPDATSANTGKPFVLLNPDDWVLVLLDHQAGLFQTANDISVASPRQHDDAGQAGRAAEHPADRARFGHSTREKVQEFRDDLVRRLFDEPVPRPSNEHALDVVGYESTLLN